MRSVPPDRDAIAQCLRKMWVMHSPGVGEGLGERGDIFS
ncbi:hypothetical protein MC7420_3067 [Coleofasciculus chthonoplastes PCC 7420]|uniref:Uncharacterized protein n=1 Tax=Coleofasciculus chthonoplastes PCC 7420 TaxID=118168 RepID=B4VK19_9CYAN|nr:hypothetical protein MC7420_3067 [Coleofasciculus chthonoplastes PCC 7420]